MTGFSFSPLAPAGPIAEMVRFIRSNPLKVKAVQVLRPSPLEWACAPLIADTSGVMQKDLSLVKVLDEDALLTLSIGIDKLASNLFQSFPKKTAAMAGEIYDEVFITEDTECPTVSSRFLRMVGSKGSYTPDIRINPQLARSLLYRKIGLLQVALRLAFQRQGEKRSGTFEHWDDSEILKSEWSEADHLRLARHSQMASHLIEKLIIDQIPIEYFQADLLSVKDLKLRAMLNQDVFSLRTVPLQGFFLSSQYRKSSRNYEEQDAKLIDAWVREELPRL